MNKNAGVMIQETQVNVAKALNESGLPPSILVLIVKDMLNQLSAMAQQELNPPTNVGETVDLGEGIEPADESTYDYDNNYTPEHAKKK